MIIVIGGLVLGFIAMCVGGCKIADSQMTPEDWEKAYEMQRRIGEANRNR